MASWNSGAFKYFLGVSNLDQMVGGISDTITEIELRQIENISYTPFRWPDNSLSLLSYSAEMIMEVDDSKSIDRALTLEIGGSDQFQHFVGDCLPYLSLVQDFLIANPEVVILLKQPNSSFSDRGYFFEQLHLTNPVIDLNELSDSLHVRDFLFLNIIPKPIQYAIPPVLYRNLNALLNVQPKNRDKHKKRIAIIERVESTRNLENLEEISEELAKRYRTSAEVITLNPRLLETRVIAEIFRCTDVLIAPHGGANYHAIFLPPGALFIEVIPTVDTDSLFHLAMSVGLIYKNVVLKASKSDFSWHVSEREIFSFIDNYF